MKPPGKRRYWRIQGHDSTEITYERRIPIGQLSEKQLQELLKALTAKAGLTYDEIVGAYATRRTEIANDLLQVHRDRPNPHFWCGNNPYFDACVVDEDGKVYRPKLP